MIDKRFVELERMIAGRLRDIDRQLENAELFLTDLMDHVGVPDPSRENSALVPTSDD